MLCGRYGIICPVDDGYAVEKSMTDLSFALVGVGNATLSVLQVWQYHRGKLDHAWYWGGLRFFAMN
jgi:hypothetical protein